MTVTVRLTDGGSDEYMRFGDAYVKHSDGSLDIVRTGSKEPHSYSAAEWTDVEGDQRKHKKAAFWR
ncbi:MAG: hypothetical protein HYZ38_26510 [Mycobacterium sp.]|nr:hypothetical protein [Mycobacterium sp.]